MAKRVSTGRHTQRGPGTRKPVRIPKGGVTSLKRMGQISFGFGGRVRQYKGPKPKQVKIGR